MNAPGEGEDELLTEGDAAEIATRAVRPPDTKGGIHIVVLSGSARGTSRPLGDKVRVGKAPDNDLVLGDDTVSRHHCELTRANDGVHVRDLGSTNGTRVQGARVSEAIVQPGTVLKVGEVEIALRPAARNVEVMPSDKTWFGAAIGRSLAMRSIFGVLERIAQTDATVLLEGETGTGKDVLARAIWTESAHAQGPFVVVDCGAVTYSLLESELFGHERGAFTDARQARIGLFEAADGGTLFLDDIGLLSPATQAKVLAAVEDGTIRRLGGTREIAVDTRLIAASNRPLADLVRQGAFREDLYHRLDLLRLALPPLRERGTDIVALARHMLEQIAARHRRAGLTITPGGEARLLAQPWRGNVRELAHEIERAVIFSGSAALDFAHLDGPAVPPAGGWRNPAWSLPATGFSLDTLENELIAEALRETGDNVSAAARRLGVTREFIRYRLPGGKPRS